MTFCLTLPPLPIYRENVSTAGPLFSSSSAECKLHQSKRRHLFSSPLRGGFQAKATPNEISSMFGGLSSIFTRDSSAGLFLTRAKKKYSEPRVVKETEPGNEDFISELNKISNEALKVMVLHDEKAIDALNEKVDYLERYLVQEGEMEAGKFLSVIKGMLNHTVPTTKDELIGVYEKAFEKIWNIVEDSGWRLNLECKKTTLDMMSSVALESRLRDGRNEWLYNLL